MCIRDSVKGVLLILVILTSMFIIVDVNKDSHSKNNVVIIRGDSEFSRLLYRYFKSKGYPVVLLGENNQPISSSIINDTVKNSLTEKDIQDLIRVARGDPISPERKETLERKLGLKIDGRNARLVLKSLDSSGDRDPDVVFVGRYNMYINLRNSYARMEHWLVTLEKYDANHNKIADKLEKIMLTGEYKVVIPGRKILLDLGDKKITIEEIPDTIVSLKYNPDDFIPVHVAAADRDIEAAMSVFKSLGGIVTTVYREIYAFSGYIRLNRIGILAQHPAIGFVEFHNKYFYPMTAWSILQMRIGTTDGKMVPPSLYPLFNETPWGRGILGDPNMAIAIVDTGIDDTHPLTNKVIYWTDYTADSAREPEDYQGHGTHCASIAAGNIWSEDFVEWEIIARNRTDNFGASGSYTLYIDQPGWYGVAALYYISSGTPDISFKVYDQNGNLLNTSRRIYNSSYVEIEQAVFYASVAGTYNVSVTNQGTIGGILIVTWEKQFPYGGYGSTPGRHAGVAPNVKLVGLKIFDRSGLFGDYNFDSIRWLIQNASEYNITVSSNSWGGGDDATLNQLMNQLVTSGVVTVVAAGNDGAGGNIGSPGSADLVITIAAMNDLNEISEYSTSGDTTTGNTIKPDVSANGGTGYYNGDYIDPEDSDLDGSSGAIAAADSNDADNSPRGGGLLGDANTTSNNFWDIQGTSMATPHVSGLAALIISAMGGVKNWVWDAKHALKVKMIILMTAVEFTRAESGQTVPPLNRGGKDNVEGYGRINGDGAIMAVLNEIYVNNTYRYTLGSNDSSLLAQSMAPRVWAGKIYLEAGSLYRFNLSVPPTADFDLYIYYGDPDEYGQPIIAAKSTSNATGGSEVVDFLAPESGYYYVVVKWVDRSNTNPAIPDEQNYGEFSLNITLLAKGIPLVKIVQPEDGDTVDGLMRIYVNATDVDGTIASVILNISNSTWSKVVNITSNFDALKGLYYYDWNTTEIADGYYTILAQATDNESKTNNDSVVVKVWNNIPPILLVDDDQDKNYESYYEQALQALGYQRDVDYLYWNTSLNGTPPRDILDKVVIVIWFTGDDYLSTLTSTERSALSYYLSRCGQLFISGQDIGYDINSSTWYSTWLRAIYERDDTNIYNVTGVSRTIFDSAFYLLNGSDSANNNNYPDEIRPYNGSSLILYYDADSTIGAAVSYDREYRLVYMAFPFEAINGSANRADAMQRAIGWMKSPIARIYDYEFSIGKTYEKVELSIAARAFYYISTVDVLVNGTSVFSWKPCSRTYIDNITIDTSVFPAGTLNITLKVLDKNSNVASHSIFITREHLYLDLVYPRTYDPVWSTTRMLVNASTYGGVNLTSLNVTISNATWSMTVDIVSNYDNATGYYYYDWNTSEVSDGPYNITIVGLCNEGTMREDTALTVGVWNGIIPIVVVDEDRYETYESYYISALDSLGYSINRDFAYWNISWLGTPPNDFLNRALIVIWVCGLSYPSESEQDAIANYLSSVGQLFISGQDIGWGIGSTDWYKQWLRAIYERDDTNINNVTGVPGTIFDSAFYNLSGSDSANNNYWPDEIDTYNGSFLIMYYGRDPNTGAAIAYDNEYRLIYFAFPFESINGSSNRVDAMQRILGWFKRPIGVIESPPNQTITNTNLLNVSIVAKAFYGVDIVRLYINGSPVLIEDVNTKIFRRSYPINISSYPDYTVLNLTLLVSSNDGSRDSYTIFIIRDRVAPTIRIINPADNTYTNVTQITVTWSGSDNVGVDHYEVKADDNSWINVDGNTSYTFSLDEGIHIIYVRAFDVAGNLNVTSVQIIVDLTSPIFVDVDPGNNTYVQSKVTFVWNFTDNYGLGYYRIRIDGGSWVTTTGTSYTFEYLTEGNHTVEIVAYDKAGNPTYVEVHIIADTTNPTIAICSPEGGSYLNSSEILVEWNMSDNYGVDHCEIRLDGGEWVNVGLSYNYTLEDLVEGSHIIEIRVYDKAGNYEEDSIVVTVDLTSPSFISISPGTLLYTNASWVVLSWDATDNTGIERYLVSINGSKIDVGSNTTYNVTGLGIGENYVILIAIDKAGNSVSRRVEIYVDRQAPLISIYAPYNNSFVNTDTLTLTWNMMDDYCLDSVLIRVDNGSWIHLGISYSYVLYNLTEEKHFVTLRVLDKAGNGACVTIRFTVDYTPPTISVLYPHSGAYINSTNISICWSSSDNFGVSSYALRIDGGSWVSLSNSTHNVVLPEGLHIIDIVAYDYAGNDNSTRLIVYIDTSPPTINILSPHEGEYLNLTTVEVEWNIADNFGVDKCLIRIDNEAWINVSDFSYAFTNLQDGEHKVSIIAYDYAGNSAEASVRFVVDKTKPKISVIAPKNGTTIEEGIVQIIWNITDNIALDHIEILVDNGSWQNIGLATTMSIKMKAGTHRVTLRAYDKAGNVAETTVVFFVTKKPQSPIAQLLGILLIVVAVATMLGTYIYYHWKKRKMRELPEIEESSIPTEEIEEEV